ncbi:MAG TPA: MlaD family protein, partial [Marmoricola sp.]|nr:MlaD family protein [Marmoricola sp.]
LALAAIGTAFAAYFLSHERFNPPWENKYTVFADFKEAVGVSPGNGQEVRLAGVEVGDIRSASLDSNGTAKLELRIDDKYKLYANARALLRPKSPLNDMYVELSQGTPSAGPLKAGSTIPDSQTVSPVAVDEVLAHLDVNAQAALTTLLSESDAALVNAPAQLPSGLNATTALIKDLKPVMTQLATRRETLSKLVHSLADVAAATGQNDTRLQSLANSLTQTLSTVSHRGSQLNDALSQLPDLSTRLRAASGSVEQLASQLDPTLTDLQQASGTLPGALKRLGDSMGHLGPWLDHAKPVVSTAVPVLANLRPFMPSLGSIAQDLRPLSVDAQLLTASVVPHLNDVAAFVYNTNSVASLHDANRGILRGLFAISPQSIGTILGAIR